MSHFVVLVVGDNVEEQLAPYHEYECTGINDKYVQDIDVTAKCIEYGTDEETGKFNLKEGLSYYGLDDAVVSDESEVCKEGDGPHKYGYAIVKDGVLVKAVNRTNPNRKWDWYQVGGRWNGYFKVKAYAMGQVSVGPPGLNGISPNYRAPGTDRADQCLKGDIDIEGMRQQSANEAMLRYDLYNQAVQGFPSIVLWEQMLEKHGEQNIDAARREYNEQPAIQALGKSEKLMWYQPEEFQCTREEYVERARRKAIASFAVVKDGQWYERGCMGWWGTVFDEKDEDQWLKQFSELIDSLPDSTLLTVVDCHI